MKRLFSFLLLVLLLSVAVGALQVWKARRDGVPVRGPLGRFFEDVTVKRQPEKYTIAEGPRIDVKDVNVLAALSHERILLARAVVPSVVSITTSRAAAASSRFRDDPIFRFFHGGGGGRVMPEALTKSLGSGVIISKEGHIITNNHVIEGMDQIEVELNDGRKRTAKLIGADETTDLAVLRIDAGDLQPLPFGNSDQVEVGETVMAVGNPYGLEESVTQGIISAKGRANESISDLLQTDAAINPGNSGGPLINVQGELIGINEAIYSRSGGWQGVGFAIPSVTVRRTMDAILRTGRAVHGYLGVNLKPITPDSARELGLPDSRGALVDDVVPDSPADRAHIRQGDFIRRFNNRSVSDIQELRRHVAGVDVDATVPVELLRAGKTLTFQATIREKPPEAQLSRLPVRPSILPPEGSGDEDSDDGKGSGDDDKNNGDGGDDSGNGGSGRAGEGAANLAAVRIGELTPLLVHQFDVPVNVRGVVVQGVRAGSSAASPLRAGDVIEQVNQEPVATPDDYRKQLSRLPTGEPVKLAIVRERARMLVVVRAE